MTRFVVTGGSHYGFVEPHTPGFMKDEAKRIAERQRGRFEQIMDAAVERLGLSELAAGRCGTGVDELTLRWAKRRKLPFEGFSARWQEFGDAAGPERNGRMLRTFRPEKVIAFPGGKGTADCVLQAEALGIDIIRIDWK